MFWRNVRKVVTSSYFCEIWTICPFRKVCLCVCVCVFVFVFVFVGGAVFFFSSVNIKSAREPHFFGFVHGHCFAFTGRNFGKSARVLFAVYEHVFGKILQKKPNFRCWAVCRGSRTLSLEMFTGTLEVHGQFLQFQFTGTVLRFTGEKNTAVVWLSFWFSTRFNLKISVPSNGRNRV